MSRHLRIRKSQTPQIRFCIFKAKWPGIVDKLVRGRQRKLIESQEILRWITKNAVICRRRVVHILNRLFWHVAHHAAVGRRSGLSFCKRRPAGLDRVASEASRTEVLCRLRSAQLHVRIMAGDATHASFARNRAPAES